jgi:hypothetical protein
VVTYEEFWLSPGYDRQYHNGATEFAYRHGGYAHIHIFAQGFTQSPSPTARGQARPSTFLHLPYGVTMVLFLHLQGKGIMTTYLWQGAPQAPTRLAA